MNGSTKFAIFLLIVVVLAGEMSKEPGVDGPRPKIIITPPVETLPPLPDGRPEGVGKIGPGSESDPIIEINEERKGRRQTYTGTAFSIDDRGLWVTARHVTNGCDRLALLRPGTRPIRVLNVAEHNNADVSLLQTDGGYSALPIDFNAPEFNQEGFHYGFPRGEPGAVYSRLIGRRTIKSIGDRNSKETVLAWAEKIRVPNSDEALGGISGGPILNKEGSVVGVHVAGSVRRGRSFSSLPSAVERLIDQNNIQLNDVLKNPADLTELNQTQFAQVGEELRKGLTVAQVLCVTN